MARTERQDGHDRGLPPLPVWVRVLDLLALGGLLVALSVLVSGGYSAPVGPFRFSSHSIVRPLVLATLAAALRHALFPAVPLHRRIGAWPAALRHPSRAVIATAIASRLAVLIVGYFAVVTIGFTTSYGFRLSPYPLMNLPARFDAGWYGDIALDGYQFNGRFDTQQNFAFFPAYPMLVRAVGSGIGAFEPGVSRDQRMARALWGGVIISILGFAWGAGFLARLARDTIGDEHAATAAALLASYPFAVYYSAPYTESLFLLGSVAAFYHYRRREWRRAALWGLLVGLTRPNGCLLSVVLACLALEHLCRRHEPWRTRVAEYSLPRAVLAAAAPGIGMLAHSAFVRQLTGDWLGWARAHGAWGREFQGLAPLARLSEWIENGLLLEVSATAPFDTLNAMALLFALLMLWPVFRRVGLAAGVFVLVNIVPPLLTGSVLSMGRFTSTLFPIFLALAAMLPRPLVPTIVAIFAIGQGFAAALFFTWRALF